MIRNPTLVLLGSHIVGTAIALVNTHPSYQKAIEDLQIILAVAGFILSAIALWKR